MPDTEPLQDKTVRELSGEVWAELFPMPESEIQWELKTAVADLLMDVLAQHVGATIVNDAEWPVAPLPKKVFPGDDSR